MLILTLGDMFNSHLNFRDKFTSVVPMRWQNDYERTREGVVMTHIILERLTKTMQISVMVFGKPDEV
jgi:hypothetical protein